MLKKKTTHKNIHSSFIFPTDFATGSWFRKLKKTSSSEQNMMRTKWEKFQTKKISSPVQATLSPTYSHFKF